MEGVFMLTFLCITMLIGSFFSGLIPLTLTLSEAKMKHITILGAGLLIGTALAVIIPEGIHTLYSNKNNEHLINEKHLQRQMIKRSLNENFDSEPIKKIKRFVITSEDDQQKLDIFLNQISTVMVQNKILLNKRNIPASDNDKVEVFIDQLSSGNRNNRVLRRFVLTSSDYKKLELYLNQIGSSMNVNKVIKNKRNLDLTLQSDKEKNNKFQTSTTNIKSIQLSPRLKRDSLDSNNLNVENNKINHFIAQEKIKENDFSKDSRNIDQHNHDNESDTTHSSIGITLVLGFVFMLIVDQIGGNVSHRHQTLDTQAIRNKITFTTTLGLVVHAAADGIALGAAAATSRTDVEMIVFIAIMLHKAPAAFGLVSFLIHEGLERARVRKHLIVFSMAAPLMAIFTFTILKYQSTVNIVSSDSTGLCMLFSAGTFLYVSTVHVLPEVQAHNEDRQFRFSEMLSFIVGSIIPLFLSVGHSH